MSTAKGSPLQNSITTQRIGLAGLACLIVAFWMLIHPYRGLEHDSVLYAVLALARLHPAALGHDMFVRYGTQDSFTVFSPLFAAAISAFGLEQAAAILTLLTHVAFFFASWLLARRLMAPGLALLAVGLLVVLPSWYGSNSVFASVEAFLTPRQLAEAFALAGLAAALCSRQVLAAICMLAAMLLHPIIAAAGVTTWIILVPAMARPRLAGIATAIVAVCLVGLSVSGIGPFKHFDQAWLSILQERLAYLFPTNWRLTEWVTTEVHAAVLVVGIAFTRSEPVRRLCIAALIAVVLGLAFSIVESDGLHVVLAAQLQTWRWLWLLGVLSMLLLPTIAIDCWRAGDLGRAAVLCLLGALADPRRSNRGVAGAAGLRGRSGLVANTRVSGRRKSYWRLAWRCWRCAFTCSLATFPTCCPSWTPSAADIGHTWSESARRRPWIMAGLLPAAVLVLVFVAINAPRGAARCCWPDWAPPWCCRYCSTEC